MSLCDNIALKMSKRTRLMILLVCVVCFFIATPVLVAYSIGYRFDFENMKITSTGGIYVHTSPAAEQVIIDSKIVQKPGIFSNAIFTQSLLPGDHTILAQKKEYYDYFKTIPVEEKEVTKLENVILFKKDTRFELVDATNPSPFEPTEKYIIKNNNLYYSDILENVGITATQKVIPIIKNISTFSLQNSNIVWLGTDGLLYRSDPSNFSQKPIALTTTPIEILKTGTYDIVSDNSNIFINNNSSLMFLNPKTNELVDFYSPASDIKISPDAKNIIYYSNNDVYVSLLPMFSTPKNNLLYKASGKVTGAVWLNNYYIAVVDGDNIIISETDYRGNINTATLPQTAIVIEKPLTQTTTTASKSTTEPVEKSVAIKNPQIYFNQQEGKLYILTEDTLLTTEKIIP